MGEKQKSRESSVNTPYDDVFRTMLNDCRQLILPVINEIFGRNYLGEEEILFSPNEHFLNCQDGAESKRITDSSLKVIGEDEQRYLLECQSNPDNSMLIRFFEYDTQIALDEGVLGGNRLKVVIPHSAVVFLRDKKNTPDKMEIELETSGGTVVFDVYVMKVRNYTLEEIFEKNLLFLIPFYIFTHEGNFNRYNTDEKSLQDLKKEYATIVKQLDSRYEEGRLTAYTRKVILEMSVKVLESIARKYEKVREGVKSVMGGNVLEYEAKTIYNEGRHEGRNIGRMESKRETALNLYKMGLSKDMIAQAVEVSVVTVGQWLEE